jgi:hypothetical protein
MKYRARALPMCLFAILGLALSRGATAQTALFRIKPANDQRCLGKLVSNGILQGGLRLVTCDSSLNTTARMNSDATRPGFIAYGTLCVAVPQPAGIDPWKPGTVLQTVPCTDLKPAPPGVPDRGLWVYDSALKRLKAAKPPQGAQKCIGISDPNFGTQRAVILDCSDPRLPLWNRTPA